MNYQHKLVLAVLFFLVALIPAWSQITEGEPEPYVPVYSLGDQVLSINMGLFLPLFNMLSPEGVTSPNLSLGAAGALRWESYLSKDMTVGAEVGGSIAMSANRHALFMVPVTARWSYIPRRFPYEFPVSVGLGVNFSRFLEKFKIDPVVKLGGGLYWNYSSQWAFGLNAVYWIVPQIYLPGSEAGSDSSRIGNYLEFSLSALYHF